MSVVELSDTAQAREVRRLKQRVADLEQTLEAVLYMHTETEAFRAEDHPMIAQAIATREALALGCSCRREAA